jgi:mycoredoxin
MTQAALADRPIIYTTTWCGYCTRLKRQLERAEIGFMEVDIERNPGAADVVAQLNDGDQTVPTLIFPDGSTLTNPSIREVTAKLS